MRTEEREKIFRCPSCQGKLLWPQGHCALCGAAFQDNGLLIDFLDQGCLDPQAQQEIKLHQALAKDYDRRYQLDFAKVFSDYWNDQFLKHLPAAVNRVLDCGCGTGELTRALQNRAETVIGMDISRAMLQAGAKTVSAGGNPVWVACPSETMPFGDGVFDAVCFRGALHHMADEVKGLREAHRVLKSGGLLMVSEPNDDSLLLRLPRRFANRHMARFGNAHKAFRSETWLAAMRATGFRILTAKYFSFLSQPLCGMSDILPIMRYVPAARRIAGLLVGLDEILSRIPLIQRQSFDLFVVARKG